MRRKPPEECVSAGSCHLFPEGLSESTRRAGWARRLEWPIIQQDDHRPAAKGGAIGRLAPPPGARGQRNRDKGVKKNGRRAALFGGEEGIRTLERLNTFTRFPGVRLQPLIHLSVGEARIIVGLARKKQGAARSGALTFPFGPERLKTGKSKKAARGACRSEIAVGARRLGRKRRVGSPSPPPRARPCARHALAALMLLSFFLSRSPARLPRPLIGKAAARPMICRPIIAK